MHNQENSNLYWDEGVFNSSRWLYDSHVNSYGYGVVHIPLFYQTRSCIIQEIYAYAMADFPTLIELDQYFHPIVIDGAVTKFPLSELELFRQNSFEVIANNPYTMSKLANQSLAVRKWFPLLCIRAEQQVFQNGKISPVLLTRLFKMLVRLIAINLANPFIEILFMRLNKIYQDDKSYQELLNCIIWPPIFSHLSYFSNWLDKLKEQVEQNKINSQDILDFCWSAGFLGNEIGDKSEYESPEYLKALIKASEVKDTLEIKDIDLTKIKLPDIIFDPERLADKWDSERNHIEQILYFLRILQVNEEFRHYWGFRFVRLLRFITPDIKLTESWGIKEYEKFAKI